ncbi:MAG: hypothetical protein Q9197_004537, partial [Variospora fuerteventurae]
SGSYVSSTSMSDVDVGSGWRSAQAERAEKSWEMASGGLGSGAFASSASGGSWGVGAGGDASAMWCAPVFACGYSLAGMMMREIVPSGSWSSNWGPGLESNCRMRDGSGERCTAWREMDG